MTEKLAAIGQPRERIVQGLVGQLALGLLPLGNLLLQRPVELLKLPSAGPHLILETLVQPVQLGLQALAIGNIFNQHNHALGPVSRPVDVGRQRFEA